MPLAPAPSVSKQDHKHHKQQLKAILREEQGAFTREEWMATYDKFMEEFRDADTNNDGCLSADEWIAKYGSIEGFDAYDLNGDGIIDADEFSMGKQVEKDFTELDADGDGRITREEWIAKYGSDAGFDQYDLDGDGIVDADEFRKIKSSEIEFARLDKDGDGIITRDEWYAKYGNYDGFDKYDLDGDGVIDGQEFSKSRVAQIDFRRMDADRDGELTRTVTRDEWTADGRPGGTDGSNRWDVFQNDGNEFRKGQVDEIECKPTDPNRINREQWVKKHGNDVGFDAYDLDGDGWVDLSEFHVCKAQATSEKHWSTHPGPHGACACKSVHPGLPCGVTPRTSHLGVDRSEISLRQTTKCAHIYSVPKFSAHSSSRPGPSLNKRGEAPTI